MIHLALALVLIATPPDGQAPGADSLRVGERVLLKVEGEPTLSDTFSVLSGPSLLLPGVGSVPLAGVTRAGLEPYLRDYLGRYLRHPKVQAKALMRVAVLGEVMKPGYYAVASETTLADVMMLAGGPTHEAKMPEASVRRGDRDVMSGEPLAQAVAQGATVSAIGLQSGDQIVVPALERHDPESAFRIVSILVTIPVAIYGIVKLF